MRSESRRRWRGAIGLRTDRARVIQVLRSRHTGHALADWLICMQEVHEVMEVIEEEKAAAPEGIEEEKRTARSSRSIG